MGQQLWLSSQRAIFWEDENALIVADLHFGKSGHFRKAGIAIPQDIYKEDLQRFADLLQHFKPKKIIAVGDMFHSNMNSELDWFSRWRESFGAVELLLVKGNHDILPQKWYKAAGIDLIEKELVLKNFRFTHDSCDADENHYSFCGHLHPGIIVNGAGRQSLRFPCFYFDEHKSIIPAFSRFTGMAMIDKESASAVYAIVQQELVRLI